MSIKSTALLLTLFLVPFLLNGQTKKMRGKVVDENDLTPMPGVLIQTCDKLRLGMTDIKGNFEIDIAPGTDELLLSFIGMELTSIKVPADCNSLEIIMMVDAIYDFVTVETENRKRYKRFKDLKNQHHQAHEKKIFTSDTPCFTYIFRKH